MTEPMRDTLARLSEMRERTNGRRQWIQTPGLIAEYDIDLMLVEHNSGPRRDEMLERARDLLADLLEPDPDYCEGSSFTGHADRCTGCRARAWLADYEGASDDR